MSGAACPSCGVVVVPGYVRCPKCQKPLPRRVSPVVGGTSIPESRKLPVVALVGVGVVTVALVAFFALRGRDATPQEPAPAAAPPPVQAAAPETAPSIDPPETTSAPAGPNAIDVAANLERSLKRQRLWSTVTVIGDRVEVRSSSCNDPAMGPALAGSLASFKAAGLTKLRCLEQSGRVVTDRDL